MCHIVTIKYAILEIHFHCHGMVIEHQKYIYSEIQPSEAGTKASS